MLRFSFIVPWINKNFKGRENIEDGSNYFWREVTLLLLFIPTGFRFLFWMCEHFLDSVRMICAADLFFFLELLILGFRHKIFQLAVKRF